MMYTGMKPQCIPKITRICQVSPTMPPASSGLKLRIVRVNSEIRVEPKVATGPRKITATGKVTSRVSMGTKKNFTRSGMNRLNSFSHLDANHTARITGITVPV